MYLAVVFSTLREGFESEIRHQRVYDSGNIWAVQGYTSMPTFEVYDQQGQLLYVVTIPELDGVRGLDYCFHNCLLAFDYAPEDYPKVYLLSMGGR